MYNQEMTSKQLFDKLKAKRSRHEEIWELSAQYTLPHVYMSDEDRERGIEPEDLIIGDSIGAECLSNLGSQILKIAFPAQGTFFTVTAKKNAELLGGLSDSQRDTIYRKVEEASMLGLYKRGLHSQKTPMMQKMLALGDTIYSVPKVKKEKIQVYDNNDVVIKRTRNGVVSDVIVKEKTEYRFLSESAKMQLREKGRQFRHDSDEVCMYTHEYLNNDDKYSLTYSIDDVQLDMPENFVTSSGRKFQVSSLTTVRGSHYGTGIVTQYLSLIHKANVYADTATDTAVAGSLVNWAVHPNANVRPEEWANREQGEPFGVKPDDIKAITADVGTHLQITQIMYAEIVRTLSRVFLLPQAVQRDAERVTAQEIRMIASRLEETHAGLYATIAEGLQRTLADIGMSLIDDEELTRILMTDDSVIFSRVSPAHKLRIVNILEDQDEVVAVTGDGVNDAPALKRADIGVAMGITGTDVAKEAAELILLDDSFPTLVEAIREGRTIYSNLKKTVLASMTTNAAELAIVILGLTAVAMGNWAIPILALQILAIDLLAEVMPLTCLTFDPSVKGIMRISPRKQCDHIMNRQSSMEVLFLGVLIGGLAFGNYALSMFRTGEVFPSHMAVFPAEYLRATTIAYLTIAFCQFVNVFSRRYNLTSVFNRNFFNNRILLWSIVGSIGLILMAVYVPLISEFLYFSGPGIIDWLFVLGAALIFLCVFEMMKLRRRIRYEKTAVLR